MKSLVEVIQPIQNLNIVRHIFTEDSGFPNNGLLPVLLYKEALHGIKKHDTETVKEILESNSWTTSWINNIFDYHHYHSIAHEVLVVLMGMARVQFGGPNGITLSIEKGDVVIIPAGVAHKKVEEADGFSCLGAYPDGQQYDMNYGHAGERPKTDENIRNVPLPTNDPIYGNDGPLIKNWFSQIDQGSASL